MHFMLRATNTIHIRHYTYSGERMLHEETQANFSLFDFFLGSETQASHFSFLHRPCALDSDKKTQTLHAAQSVYVYPDLRSHDPLQ